MTQHNELALVLDIASYRETSSLVRVFTQEEGRISLVARGLRSAKDTHGAAALQPFNVVRVRFSLKDGATIGNLISADLEQVASATRDSIEAYAVVSFWFEILKETSQERAALTEIFELTRQMVAAQQSAPGLTLDYLGMLSRLAGALGFAINWSQCTVCGKQLPPGSEAVPRWFSISRGGIVCQSCAESESALPLSMEEGKIMRQLAHFALLDEPISKPSQPSSEQEIVGAQLLPLLNLMHRFLIHHLEHPLKTIKFVNDTIG